MWDRLTELLGEELLAQTMDQLPSDPTWLDGLTADEREMVSQARTFAVNPAEARRIVEDYRRR